MGSYPIWILILINLRHLVFGAALVGIFASIPRLTETTGRRTAAAVLLGVSVVIAVLLSLPRSCRRLAESPDFCCSFLAARPQRQPG